PARDPAEPETAEPEPAEPGPGPEPESAEPDPYAEQAPLDVDTLLADTSKAYLEARARLEAHPQLAAEAILDRLATVPPPTSTDRKRLLDVLAVLGLPDHVELFAQELRRAVLRADSFSDQGKAVTRWLPLMIDQGEIARAPLTRLVADQELPVSTRAALLDALVDVTPTADVAALVTLVGRGARSLRQQLHRSLRRRASKDPEARAALILATDTALREEPSDRIPALLKLRGALSADDDEGFTRSVGALARDDAAPFAVRVAALRALGGHDSAATHEVLDQVAREALAQRTTQRGEVLAWLALSGLPDARARALVQQHRLIDDDAPRLATLGFA
ncbi:MAG: hypothetical protein KDK70_43110, partial [Myxococcales bacterium]|nr:hypothetical protein [Myxococcales bacterium]